MTDALVKQNYDTLQQKLLDSRQKIAELLQGAIEPNKFIRGVLLAVSKNPKLLQATPSSIYLGAMQAADLGLAISDIRGEAYLVPYKNGRTGKLEAQLQTGYKGLLKLAYKTGLIEDIVVELVYEGDVFYYKPSQRDNPIYHEVNLSAPRTRDKLLLAYMIAWLKGSSRPHVEVMLKKDLDKIRDMVLKRSYSGESELWTTHYEEACRKTVLRRGLKYLPITMTPAGEAIADAVAAEEAALVDGVEVSTEIVDTVVDAVDTPEEEPDSVVEQAEEVIRKRRGRPPKSANAASTDTEQATHEAPPSTTEKQSPSKLFESHEDYIASARRRAELARKASEEFALAVKALPDPLYAEMREAVLAALGISGKSLVEVFNLPEEKLTRLLEAADAIKGGVHDIKAVVKIITG